MSIFCLSASLPFIVNVCSDLLSENMKIFYDMNPWVQQN